MKLRSSNSISQSNLRTEPDIRIHSNVISQRFIARRKARAQAHQKVQRSFLRSRKRIVRYGLLSANLVLLVAVVYFVAKSPTDSQAVRQNSVTPTTIEEATGPLDELSSADIAVHVAHTAGLPEATSIVNLADSISATESTTPADTSVVAKPQLVGNALVSYKDIQEYTSVAGDTVSAIAVRFGVSSDSVRGSNGLSGDTVRAGRVLYLPPAGTNGIVHTVTSGDTPESLASRYAADKDQIISVNDAEVSGLRPGERAFIPNGVIQARSTYNYYSSFSWGGNRPVYSANGYDYGWCTWHAANRRREIGRQIPSNLGHAKYWYGRAQASGLAVGTEPAEGAVIYHYNMGGLGHVGFVESINPDGSLRVSDMNYPIWGKVTYRTVSPSEFGSYRFIY